MTQLNLKTLFSNYRNSAKLSALLIILFIPMILLSYFFVDQKFAIFFSREENYVFWKFAREITNVGLAEHYFAIVISLIIYLRFFKPPSFLFKFGKDFPQWIYRWSWNFFYALIGSGLLLRVLKFLFGRKRPHIDPLFEHQHFLPFNHHWDFQSFPSGHTQVLFTVAFMLSLLIPKYQWAWFVLALLLGLTRAITYSHFLSDVLAGALCGILGTLWTLRGTQKSEKLKL